MFWFTDTGFPAAAAASRTATASPSVSASGFCASIPRTCGCLSACRISSGCRCGGKARSTISTSPSSISASGVACTFAIPHRSATRRAFASVREAIATTGNPASR